MRSMILYTLPVVVLCAGTAHAADGSRPVTLEPTRAQVNKAGHIYFNAVTGERIVTLFGDGQTTPADNGVSAPVWSALVENTCEAFGYTTEFYYGLDDPTGTTSLAANATLFDYGDIALDTVVDCIQVNWTVAYPDQDLDGDGMVDGVEELAGQWILWEVDNGRSANWCSRVPILDMFLFNLPGNTPENVSNGALTAWTADVDLVAYGTSTDLSFELGDSDGDCQTAAFCNSSVLDSSDGVFKPIAQCDNNFDGLPDSDIDGDGYFDWSWSVRFFSPQMGNDFDSDSDTGTLPGSSSDTIGIGFASPTGSAIDNGDGTFTWNIDTSVSDAGHGVEDRFVLFSPPTSTGSSIYLGGFWFGGFACTGGLIDTGGTGYTPPAMFQFVMYGPQPDGNPCLADMDGDEELTFFDVSRFLQDYQNGADYNGDGQTNFFDVSAFLMDFNAGCP